jgi:uncharacterized protein (TIGR03437 family)
MRMTQEAVASRQDDNRARRFVCRSMIWLLALLAVRFASAQIAGANGKRDFEQPKPLSSGVSVIAGPVLTKNAIDSAHNTCVTTAPAAVSSFLTTDPSIFVWFGLAGLGAQDSVLAQWAFNGTTQPSLNYGPYSGFSPGSNYFFCPEIIPNANSAGQWTVSVYVNSQPLVTFPPFTVSSSGGGVTLNLQTALQQLNLAPGAYSSPSVLAPVGLTFVANSAGTPGAAGTGTLLIQPVGANEVHPAGTTTEAFFIGPGIAYNTLNCTTLAWTGSGSLTGFTITRPGMANNASIPAWAMYAYDASGTQLDAKGEGNLTTGSFLEPTSYASFTLSSTTPIAQVAFCSHNGSSTYNALPLSGSNGTVGGGGTCAPTAGNLIGNGSFELPGNAGSYLQLYASDSSATNITCWTVTSGSVDYVGSYWVASQGNYSVDLGGPTGPGTIAQTFATSPHTSYTVTVDVAGNPGDFRHLLASVGGPTITFPPFDARFTTVSNMGWLTQSFNFCATGSSTTLQFSSGDPGDDGPDIDNVRVVAGGNACSGSGGLTFTGTYICTYGPFSSGPMTLTQNGTSVSGTLPNGGSVTGTVTVTTITITFTGTWTSNLGSGTITFTWDGTTLTGTWTRDSGNGDPGDASATGTTGTVTGTKNPSGGGGATVNGIILESGSYVSPTFSNYGTWTTLSALSNNWTLGVSLPGDPNNPNDPNNPLLNMPPGRSVNLSPGSYWTYSAPYSEGNALRVTLKWSDGRPDDVTVFSIPTNQPFTTQGQFTAVSGSSNISLAGTGIASTSSPTAKRVPAGTGLASDGNGNDVLLLGILGSGGSGGGSTLTILGTADIWAAGLSSPPNLTGGGGTLPPMFAIPSGSAGKAVTVTNVSGIIYNCGGNTCGAPAEGVAGSASYSPAQGTTISGIKDDVRAQFLVGVFLNGSQPAPPPLTPDYTTSSNNASFTPPPGQLVYVGNGLTSSGTLRQFVIPPGATQFYLGSMDGYSPNPGYYGDDSGSITATVQIVNASGGGGGGAGNPPPTISGTNCSPNVQYADLPGGAPGNPNLRNEPAIGVPQNFGTVSVNPACQYAAYSPVTWVHVTPTTLTSPGPGGQGSWTYEIDPQPTGGPQRQTILTVAGQQVTVIQLASTSLSCSYSFTSGSRSSPTFPYNPSPSQSQGSVSVTATGSGCVLNAAIDPAVPPAQQWAHLTSESRFGGAAVFTFLYTVDFNNNNSPPTRSINLIIKGSNPAVTLTYTINQKAGPANTSPPPTISSGGITNAASFIPGGQIAQGSFFSIFGNNLGPPNPGVKATSYPLQPNLSGVSVTVSDGNGNSVQALPVFVAQFQINAIMPSNAPLGAVKITATYNDVIGPSQNATVVKSAFGAFAVAAGRGPGIVQNALPDGTRPLNTTLATALPGTYVVLWGTGLGPLSANLGCPGATIPDQCSPDTTFQPQVSSIQVFVGGIPVNLQDQYTYAARAPAIAGVDQVQFKLPSTVPAGCYVPVQVAVNGNLYSNAVSMAINTTPLPCSDDGPVSRFPRDGGKNAAVILTRLNISNPANPSFNGTADLGIAEFTQQPAGGALGFDILQSPNPLGTCTYYNNVNFGGLLGGQLPSAAAGQSLDAGTTITVQRKSPLASQAMHYQDPSTPTSPYYGLLGGAGAVSALIPAPAFLDPGTFTVSGAGGKDVGAFSFDINVGAPATLSTQVTTIDRSTPLVLNWGGGDAATQAIFILGYSNDPDKNASGLFLCLAPAGPNRTFSVPTGMLANLPTTITPSGNASGTLLFLTEPLGGLYTTFTSSSPALDYGAAWYYVGSVLNHVTFK